MSIMKITKIEAQKKEKGRFSVFIDGKFSFGISETDLRAYGLTEGMDISEDLYESIISGLVLKRAEFLALRYLSYKNRTEKEVCQKLLSYGEFDDAVIYETIAVLKKRGYIDDNKYAEMFALSKASGNLDGINKIKRQLAQRGIDAELTSDDLGIDEVENALKLIVKKCRYLDEIDENDKRRIFNFLLRKGYSYSVINQAFERFIDEYDVNWVMF